MKSQGDYRESPHVRKLQNHKISPKAGGNEKLQTKNKAASADVETPKEKTAKIEEKQPKKITAPELNQSGSDTTKKVSQTPSNNFCFSTKETQRYARKNRFKRGLLEVLKRKKRLRSTELKDSKRLSKQKTLQQIPTKAKPQNDNLQPTGPLIFQKRKNRQPDDRKRSRGRNGLSSKKKFRAGKHTILSLSKTAKKENLTNAYKETTETTELDISSSQKIKKLKESKTNRSERIGPAKASPTKELSQIAATSQTDRFYQTTGRDYKKTEREDHNQNNFTKRRTSEDKSTGKERNRDKCSSHRSRNEKTRIVSRRDHRSIRNDGGLDQRRFEKLREHRNRKRRVDEDRKILSKPDAENCSRKRSHRGNKRDGDKCRSHRSRNEETRIVSKREHKSIWSNGGSEDGRFEKGIEHSNRK